jgi:hypothetical protein
LGFFTALEQFIRSKYEQQKWKAKGSVRNFHFYYHFLWRIYCHFIIFEINKVIEEILSRPPKHLQQQQAQPQQTETKPSTNYVSTNAFLNLDSVKNIPSSNSRSTTNNNNEPARKAPINLANNQSNSNNLDSILFNFGNYLIN